MSSSHEDSVFYANYKIILPIVLSILILLGLVATVFLIKKKSEYSERILKKMERRLNWNGLKLIAGDEIWLSLNDFLRTEEFERKNFAFRQNF